MNRITNGLGSVARRAARLLPGLVLISVPLASHVKQARAETEVNFMGTLQEAPLCTLNNGQPIEVDFGDGVMINRIDGIEYKKAIDLKIDCSQAVSQAHKLRIRGTAANFGTGLLAGNQTGFAFAFSHNDTALPLDEWIKFTAPQVPSLSVVPVKQAGANLTGGAFRTLASLVVEYQ